MSTFSDLTTAVAVELNGYSQTLDEVSYLVTGIGATDLTITVGDATGFSRGLIEIDDELIYVTAVDRSANTLTVAPFGRGYRGSTAATHAANAQVTYSPLYFRSAIQRAINETIDASYPLLFTVAATTFLYVPGQYTYTVPAAATAILGLTWHNNYTNEDVPIRRWKFDPYQSTVSIYDLPQPGATVNVSYRGKPTRMATGTDVFATVTGLPVSCEDVIRFGAAWRMLPYLEATNSSDMTAEADLSARRYGNSTSAAQLSRLIQQQYELRLQEEGMKLSQLYPIRAHYTI